MSRFWPSRTSRMAFALEPFHVSLSTPLAVIHHEDLSPTILLSEANRWPRLSSYDVTKVSFLLSFLSPSSQDEDLGILNRSGWNKVDREAVFIQQYR
ncbi:hypothetical protein C8J56DRAFT_275152 [Mycena floridula]|nr:hypothetical protein C8J56DRAFT_275152 [Mycena floridula]